MQQGTLCSIHLVPLDISLQAKLTLMCLKAPFFCEVIPFYLFVFIEIRVQDKLNLQYF